MMKRLLSAVIGLILARGAGAQPLTREQMHADIDQLADAVRSRWAYYEDRTANSGLDLNRLTETSRAAADNARTPGDFARVLREFVAALQDGHADVQMPGAPPGNIPSRRWPVRVRACAEGLVITRVAAAQGGPGRLPARGDVVVAVGAAPVAEVLAGVERTTFASTAPARRRLAIDWMQMTNDAEVTLRCVTPAGEPYTTALPTVIPGGPAWPAEDAQTWSLTWPADGVALLRVPTFATADWERWLSASVLERPGLLRESYERIDGFFSEVREKRARALVLDLRGNEGGTDMLGTHLAGHLLSEPFVYFKLSDLYFRRWSEPGGTTHKPVADPFRGEVIALIDEACFSVTDNLLRCLTDLHPRLTVIGRPSGGGTGAPRVLATLKHSRAAVTLCTMRVYGPKGGLIEGRGTAPGIKVEWTRDDVLSGRDPDLAAALRHLGATGP